MVPASYRWSRYGLAATPDSEEDRLMLAAELARELGNGWEIRVRYDYTDNDSNDAAFDYTRNRTLLSLSRLF